MKSLSVQSHLQRQHKSYQINSIPVVFSNGQYTFYSKDYRCVNLWTNMQIVFRNRILNGEGTEVHLFTTRWHLSKFSLLELCQF
jgi:hypothetical protein